MDMKIIGEALAAAAAWFGLIDKYGWLKGGGIAAAVMALLVILAIILKNRAKKDKKENEPSGVPQSIGEGAETPDEIEIERITHIRPVQAGSGEQSVGKNAKAGKKITIKDVRQEIR
uniref:hypothetical protein n=1 Tax=Candidatus Electronema sp. TaxID=2698783 RepID=UPI004056DA48